MSASNVYLSPKTKRVVYTSSGNFQVPSDVSFVHVELWGAGGGGNVYYGGSGGSFYSAILPVTPGELIPVTVGTGGVGTVTTNVAQDGSQTTFKGIIAIGGGGGHESRRYGEYVPPSPVSAHGGHTQGFSNYSAQNSTMAYGGGLGGGGGGYENGGAEEQDGGIAAGGGTKANGGNGIVIITYYI